jgi:hypothetical protein
MINKIIKVSKIFWENFIQNNKLPEFISGYDVYDYNEFRLDIKKEKFILEILSKLSKGNFILLKKTFSTEDVEFILENMFDLQKSKENFYKMDQKIPNFWRSINQNNNKMYRVPSIKDSAYYFKWNKSSNKLYDLINESWKLVLAIGGKDYKIYENNNVTDLVIPRIQIVKYPSLNGYCEEHVDGIGNQPIVYSGYLSDYKNRYLKGGAWFRKKNLNKLYLEKLFEAGDVGIFIGSLRHGVDPVKLNQSFKTEGNSINIIKNEKLNSRFWLGPNLVNSDLIDPKLKQTWGAIEN